MPRQLSSVTVLACVAAIAACSKPAAESAPDSAVPVAQAAPIAPSSAACWLQGATAAEAAARPSPLGELRLGLGGEEALLCYSRPSAKGRTVMGSLVPWGEPWRLGANEATSLTLPFAATIGGLAVPAGAWSLYAVPGAKEWEFFVNRTVQRWGIPIDAETVAQNLGSFKRPSTATAAPVEQFSFRWESSSPTEGVLIMEWENTRVDIPVVRSATQ